MTSALEQGFVATEYRLHCCDRPFAARVGQLAPALDAALRAAGLSRWGYVTAWNPGGARRGRRWNSRQNAALWRALRARQWRFCAAVAVPDGDWPAEPGFAVFEQRAEVLAALGRDFAQAAVVIGRVGEQARLHWL